MKLTEELSRKKNSATRCSKRGKRGGGRKNGNGRGSDEKKGRERRMEAKVRLQDPQLQYYIIYRKRRRNLPHCIVNCVI